jgi:hypothetical protein
MTHPAQHRGHVTELVCASCCRWMVRATSGQCSRVRVNVVTSDCHDNARRLISSRADHPRRAPLSLALPHPHHLTLTRCDVTSGDPSTDPVQDRRGSCGEPQFTRACDHVQSSTYACACGVQGVQREDDGDEVHTYATGRACGVGVKAAPQPFADSFILLPRALILRCILSPRHQADSHIRADVWR